MLASTAPFAQVDALINQGVSQLLANATASWQGGKPFGVSFEIKPFEALGSVGEVQVFCSLLLSAAPGLDQGGVLVINGREWTVMEPLVADSAGWATVPLREGRNG